MFWPFRLKLDSWIFLEAWFLILPGSTGLNHVLGGDARLLPAAEQARLVDHRLPPGVETVARAIRAHDHPPGHD